MDITYSRNIHNIKIEPQVANLSNVITHVRSSYVATDGVNTSVLPETTQLDVSTIDANVFVDIANVSVDLIQSWVANTLQPDILASRQAMLNSQLALQAATQKSAPWVTLGVLPSVQNTSANTANT